MDDSGENMCVDAVVHSQDEEQELPADLFTNCSYGDVAEVQNLCKVWITVSDLNWMVNISVGCRSSKSLR
jgi:hypothetical protein